MAGLMLAAATKAYADGLTFWQRLLDPNTQVLAAALHEGDVLLANISTPDLGAPFDRSISVHRAYNHYKWITNMWPAESTAHLRLGGIIVHLMGICRPSCNTPEERQLAREALDHWETFITQRAGDPMAYELLFDRAILRTKLGGANLRDAASDYQALIALGQTGVYLGSPAVIRLNLAEVLMMQGDLDASVDEYRVAVSLAREASAVYGLAVALDRLGYMEEARTLVRDLGESAYADFRIMLDQGSTFYVPDGEVYYYLGVVLEALGQPQQARAAFAAFVASGANPQFAPQASAHVKRLTAKPGR